MASRWPSWIFVSASITQEAFEQSIWNFAGWLVHIGCRSCLILEPIGNPIWPPGSHLGFSFPLKNISRNILAIDLKFCRYIGTYETQVKFYFGADRKSNMAAWWSVFMHFCKNHLIYLVSLPVADLYRFNVSTTIRKFLMTWSLVHFCYLSQE